jgi:hypothetical protein
VAWQTNFAQRTFTALEPQSIANSDTSKLVLGINNLLFFKNNEYFTKLWPGYTLPGNSLHPEFSYRLSSQLSVNFGAQWVYFYGKQNATAHQLTWGVTYLPNQHWTIKSGYLNSSLSHHLLEEMLNPETIFLHPVENGLQFLYQNTKFTTDIWLDWEQFILWKDPFQEHLTQGTSSKFKWFENERWSLKTPLQTIITHHGGQIDSSPLGVETLINTALGYNLERKFTRFSLFLDQYIFIFNDMSPEKRYPFKDGRAFLSQGGISSASHLFSVGYWYGDYFITTKGNPIFCNYNNVEPNYIEPQRAFILIKYEYHLLKFKNWQFTTAFDAYYDIFNAHFEYSYGVYFNINQLFTLIKQP